MGARDRGERSRRNTQSGGPSALLRSPCAHSGPREGARERPFQPNRSFGAAAGFQIISETVDELVMGVPHHASCGPIGVYESRDMVERSQVAGVREGMLDQDVAISIASGELDSWIRAHGQVERMPRWCVTRCEAHDGVARLMLRAQPVPGPVRAFACDDPVGE